MYILVPSWVEQMGVFRQFKYYLLRLKRLRGSPRSLAGGVAIGTFVGLTPTIPFHTVLILILCFSTRTSAVAAVITSWIVCNPLSLLPIYSGCAYIGNIITPFQLNMEKVRILMDFPHTFSLWHAYFEKLMHLGYETAFVMLTGSVCLALPLSIIAYFASLSLFTRRTKKTG